MHRLRKILFSLATGSVALVLAACYGMPWVSDRIIKTVNSTNDPIPGLKLDLYQGSTLSQTQTSDDYGRVMFTSNEPSLQGCRLVVTDIDGAANLGDFASQEQILDGNDSAELVITLEPKP